MSQPTKFIKISQLLPTSKSFCLQFQISQILSKKSQLIRCTLVDDTGTVQSEFNQFVDHFQLGEVYVVKGLKVKLVQNKMRIYMEGKTTKLQVLPQDKQFKLKNFKINMSNKYYVNKDQYERINNELDEKINSQLKVQKKHNQVNNKKQTTKLTKQLEDVKITNNDKPRKMQQNFKKQAKQQKPQAYIQKKVSYKQSNRKQSSQQQLQKPLYISKPTDRNRTISTIQKSSHSSNNPIHTPLSHLLTFPFTTKHTILVWLQPSRRIEQKKGQFWKCWVADQTGGIRLEFFNDVRLEENEWYEITNVKVVEESRGKFQIYTKRSSEVRPWNGKVGAYDKKPVKFINYNEIVNGTYQK